MSFKLLRADQWTNLQFHMMETLLFVPSCTHLSSPSGQYAYCEDAEATVQWAHNQAPRSWNLSPGGEGGGQCSIIALIPAFSSE
eukprot:scaffold99669_cov21-Prasinocladus_malaysianus.AAC.3